MYLERKRKHSYIADITSNRTMFDLDQILDQIFQNQNTLLQF
jgi:hypothetical protein